MILSPPSCPPTAAPDVAQVLTPGDFATLRHLAEKGTGKNTLRAIASDLNYLEAWAQASLGTALPWPAPEALALKFVAHHLYDEDERDRDASHGMPGEVRAALFAHGCLRADGPHAPATVRRRLALWSTMHRWKGLDAPFSLPSVRHALRLAVRANPRPRTRKSERAVTRDVIAACDDGSFCGVRDKAILLLAFASGGRRRSEIAALRLADLVDRDPLPAAVPGEPPLPASEIRLGRTKTASAEADERVFVVGRPVLALKQWGCQQKAISISARAPGSPAPTACSTIPTWRCTACQSMPPRGGRRAQGRGRTAPARHGVRDAARCGGCLAGCRGRSRDLALKHLSEKRLRAANDTRRPGQSNEARAPKMPEQRVV